MRSLLINAFCDSYLHPDAKWKQHFVVVLDGGDCFFRARYNPGTSTIDDIEINGET